MSRVLTLLLGWLVLVGGVQVAHAQGAPDAPPSALPSWPAPGAPLKVQPLTVPKGFRKKRIYLDAGQTHHALDFKEAARWKEDRTLEAFSAAVAQGLVDALSAPATPAPPVASTGVAGQE